MRRIGLAFLFGLSAVACGGGSDSNQCEGFEEPSRELLTSCADVDPASPTALVECLKGSGYLGSWTVDADGLPAFDFKVEQRCDSVASAYTPRPNPLRDPIHLVGNGHGVVAMAHASGGVELYSQDRGHKWINKIDTWVDSANPDYPQQIGGGFNYLIVDGKVRSTRFEDMDVGEALERQTRRFGVGYYETVTSFDDFRVTRRVLAPEAGSRALVSEITFENLTDTNLQIGLVEFWDVNLHQVTEEIATSDLLNPSVTEQIDRRRREAMAAFTHTVSYSKDDRIAIVDTAASSLPDGVSDRDSVSKVDYFPDPVFLAMIDGGAPADAVWLTDEELWGDKSERTPPSAAADDGNPDARTVEVPGAGQREILAMRVPVQIPVGSPVTRRFAFGYSPRAGEPVTEVAELRARNGEIADETAASWLERLIWVAVQGATDSGVIQRELAWSSYNLLANVTHDEHYELCVLGQGGSYKYIHGLDGAIGDLALFAEAMIHVDPNLAKETLLYGFSTQHGSTSETPWRFPYASTGVGDFSDVVIYDQRSDAYVLMPSIVGKYVGWTRDRDFLYEKAGYWPASSEELGSVLEHVARSLDYVNDTLGFGARGFIAMGTGDYADGVLNYATEEATRQGASSVFNAGIVVHGFPLLVDMLTENEPDLAAALNDLLSSQASAIDTQAWSGDHYYRGFVDSGNPLAEDLLFLEPQLFPLLAGLVDTARRDLVLDMITEKLETDIGAMTTVELEPGAGMVGGADEPLVGGIWPVANAWLTEAYALRSADEAWDSLVRTTLAAHADKYPGLWYGIWTGPDSYNGPASERPGEADAHLATALTDYPALNSHVHAGPIRALVSLLGVEPSAAGWTIAPRLPSETFSVVMPRLELYGTPTSIRGVVSALGTEEMTMVVKLPSGLLGSGIVVKVRDAAVEFSRGDDTVEFTLPVRRDEAVSWVVQSTSGA